MARGRLIEVLGGWLEVRSRPEPDPLAMVEGRRGRLSADGPLYEVHRVSDCAAYLFKVFDPPQFVEVDGRQITVRRGPVEPGISRSSRFVA